MTPLHAAPDSSASRAPSLDGEERLRLALAAAGGGEWDLDLGRRVFSRPPLGALGGAGTAGAWTYDRFAERVLPADRPSVDAAVDAAGRDGGDWAFRCRVRLDSGETRSVWARGRVQPAAEPARGADRMTGIVVDATEHAAASDDNLFRQAVAEAPVPVLLHADDGEILQVSRALTELTGYAASELPTIAAWTQRAYDGDQRQAVRDDVQRLHHADGRVDEGEYAVRVRSGETRVWAFHSAPLGLDARGRRLVVSMAADVTARHRAERELRRVSQQLLQAEEQERRRLARELHDELGAFLTSLQFRLRQALAADATALADAQALVRAMIDTVRSLSLDLRPSLLDDLGLAPALRQLASQFASRTQIAVDLRSEVADGERFAPEVETAAYRIAQEALTNAARHAGVARVQVLCHRDPDRLVLHVSDEGRGFDPDAAPEADSGGLEGMRERAELAGGACEITSAPEAGTRVTASLPAGPVPSEPSLSASGP